MLVNHLTQKERGSLLNKATDKQKVFIKEYLKHGRRTVFSNVLAKGKASSVKDGGVESAAKRWELIDYLDAGNDWQTQSQLFCECGRKLRYQYVVRNDKTGETKKFGITHFQDHTDIPPDLVKDIVKGIEKIDFEMDELLLKIADGWSLLAAGITGIPDSVEIPRDIQEHFDHDVPLLESQIRRLKGRMAQHIRNIEIKALENRKRIKAESAQQRKSQMKVLQQQNIEGNIISETVPLEEKLQLGVVVYLNNLKKLRFQATEVCLELIDVHGDSSESYSSGKPRIFPFVCMYLEYLSKQGLIYLVEKQGVDDRTYDLIETVDINGG